MHCAMPMPVMTTRLSCGSKVSSCDDICSALRDGARRCCMDVGRCRLVGTSDMTPAAQAIWRNIRPMLNEGFLTKLAASPGLHELDLFSLLAVAYAINRAPPGRPRASRRNTRGPVLGVLPLPLGRITGLRGV